MAELRILVVDGNTAETNARHVAEGGRPTGGYYAGVLERLRGGVACTVVHPADRDVALPAGAGLGDFDGIAWTGSALNVYRDEPPVRRLVELARAALASGTPVFGSCWGLQVATVAAGGRVAPNPRGRELGIARRIEPTEAGAAHPMLDGKRGAFDAICVHMDEVVAVAPGTTVLARNAMSAVQAAEIAQGPARFWGVQYHPEYDLNEIAVVIRRYGDALVEAGFFADRAALDRYTADLLALHRDPSRGDLAWMYGIDATVLDERLRFAELRNWLDRMVAPMASARGRG